MSRADDLTHLHMLGVFHYVVAALIAVTSLIPLFQLWLMSRQMREFGAYGGLVESSPFTVIGTIVIVAVCVGFLTAICMLIAGSRLKQCRSYSFCLFVAAVECMFTPMGTILGVFTIVVLMRRSVREMFGIEVREQ